ncbi:exopolygalacturonase-like [Macadamia integrifolia]|uniref:exopolygalacturonase-like n=1 Tax=Macadamia integrifolia TaxID=60698 RepID=UPI001C4FF6D3|nr:exopolygalacturonase-like [Macadamia integrifolia]
MRPDIIKFIFFSLCFISLAWIVTGGRVAGGGGGGGGKTGGPKGGAVAATKQSGGSGTFNVKNFGAKGDGRNDDSKAFTAAWKAACGSKGPVKLFIPKGTFLLGPIKFVGPCNTVDSFTVQMQGFLKASTDLSRYGSSEDWIEFGWVEGLTLTGGGTFDGQGAASWPFNKCPTNVKCKVLPTNVKFVQMTNTIVKSITSLNSKFFHIAVLDCKNFKGSGIRISAPGNSPNTDGIHLERSSDVTISDSVIGTGDDCVSIGQGNTNVHIKGVSCGPGHGISVGSLGKYQDEGDVTGLVVRDCTLSGTMNGVRIKTWANSPDSSVASNMTFEDIVMNNVANPIIIDQTYCPYSTCDSMAPSRVKLSDLYFRNIRGTSSSPVAVTLECSKGVPCQNVNFEEVHLDLARSGGNIAKSSCRHVAVKYSGTQIPPPCSMNANIHN